MDVTNWVARVPPLYLALSCLGGLVLVLVLKRILSAIFTPLRSVPGPFAARFTRLWFFRESVRGNFHKTNIKLHRQYGPIVRLTPNLYSIDDPAAVRILYSTSAPFLKGYYYSAVSDPSANVPDLFSDRNPKRHAANRRYVSNFFSVTSLLKMEEVVKDCVGIVERKFNDVVDSGKTIDFSRWLQCYAFDVIGDVTVNKRFGFLDDGEDHFDMLSSLHAALTYVARVSIYWEWHPFFFSLVKRLGKSGTLRLFAFTNEQIDERLATMKNDESRPEGEDFLTRVLRLHQQEPNNFTMENVFAACMQNIGAGSDTTGISLSAIMNSILEHPETLRKLRAEIDEKAGSGELSDPPTFAETQKMPYLQAVLKEGLRAHSAVGQPFERIIPEGGTTIAGRFFPAGTVVGINPWVAHANQDVYGDDADDFRAERWLEDKEKATVMDRYMSTFGHGARSCLGKNLSLMEIALLVTQLVRKFDFHPINPDKKLEFEWISFVKPKDFFVTITRRQF